MKHPFNYLLIFILAFGIGPVRAQENYASASVKEKLRTDSLAFEQFNAMGKCRCIDTLMKNKFERVNDRMKFYPAYYRDMVSARYALTGVVKPEVMNTVLDGFYSRKVGGVLERLGRNDKDYDAGRSPLLICENIYADSEYLRGLYMEMLGDPASYYPNVRDPAFLRKLRWDEDGTMLELPFHGFVDPVDVLSLEVHLLDVPEIAWNFSENDVAEFFGSAEEVTNAEAAEIISTDYSPFSVTGELTCGGVEYNYLIHPAGVGILSTNIGRKFMYTYFKYGSEDIRKRLFDTGYSYPRHLEFKIISQEKECKSNQGEFGEWCDGWTMPAYRVDEYFALCDEWDETRRGSPLTLFNYYPCAFRGYALWSGKIYLYWLWSSGPFLLSDLDSDAPSRRLNFACTDPAGAEYIFEVDEEPSLDR